MVKFLDIFKPKKARVENSVLPVIVSPLDIKNYFIYTFKSEFNILIRKSQEALSETTKLSIPKEAKEILENVQILPDGDDAKKYEDGVKSVATGILSVLEFIEQRSNEEKQNVAKKLVAIFNNKKQTDHLLTEMAENIFKIFNLSIRKMTNRGIQDFIAFLFLSFDQQVLKNYITPEENAEQISTSLIKNTDDSNYSHFFKKRIIGNNNNLNWTAIGILSHSSAIVTSEDGKQDVRVKCAEENKEKYEPITLSEKSATNLGYIYKIDEFNYSRKKLTRSFESDCDLYYYEMERIKNTIKINLIQSASIIKKLIQILSSIPSEAMDDAFEIINKNWVCDSAGKTIKCIITDLNYFSEKMDSINVDYFSDFPQFFANLKNNSNDIIYLLTEEQNLKYQGQLEELTNLAQERERLCKQEDSLLSLLADKTQSITTMLNEEPSNKKIKLIKK